MQIAFREVIDEELTKLLNKPKERLTLGELKVLVNYEARRVMPSAHCRHHRTRRKALAIHELRECMSRRKVTPEQRKRLIQKMLINHNTAQEGAAVNVDSES